MLDFQTMAISLYQFIKRDEFKENFLNGNDNGRLVDRLCGRVNLSLY